MSWPLWVLQRSSEGCKRRKGGQTPHRIPFLTQCSQTAPIASFLIFGVLCRRHLKKKKKQGCATENLHQKSRFCWGLWVNHFSAPGLWPLCPQGQWSLPPHCPQGRSGEKLIKRISKNTVWSKTCCQVPGTVDKAYHFIFLVFMR